MTDRHLQSEFCGSNLKRVMRLFAIVALLIAYLNVLVVCVIAQDDVRPDPKSQTLEIHVVDEEGSAIEGASLEPSHVEYQRNTALYRYSDKADTVTDAKGKGTLVFPLGRDGPIRRVRFDVAHDSFLGQKIYAKIEDKLVEITLKRGVQVTASGLDPVTKKPIKKDLYAWTNHDLQVHQYPVAWQVQPNGTLVSPLLGKDITSLRLVQLADGKAIRFSTLVDMRRRDKSRFLFSDLEMVDAVTVNGKLGEEVTRPVESGMVMACVTSITEADHSPDSRQSAWRWKVSSKINPDGTFTLEGIPANSALQVICGCQGWANKPLTQEQATDEFPKEDKIQTSFPLPQLFQIGAQDREITVDMQPLGGVKVKLVDQNNQPIERALILATVSKYFFYTRRRTSYTFDRRPSSLNLMTQDPKDDQPSPFGDVEELTDFQYEFSSFKDMTDAAGTAFIDGIPPGNTHVFVSRLGDNDGIGQRGAGTFTYVKSNENVSVGLKIDKLKRLKLQVVDEEGAAIEDVSLQPSQIVYQRDGLTCYQKSLAQSIVTNEKGEATFFVPVEVKEPVISVLFTVKHDSFVEQTYTADIADEDVTFTLERGLQVAASGVDPVTKKPIERDLYAMTNRTSSTLSAPVDWNIRSNGTLISPILGAKESSLRLVQLAGGKAIRFSKLVDLRPRDKSRLRFSNLEMIDAVTITGKLGDEVPRPVKSGMVKCCVVSMSQNDEAANPGNSWCWRSFSKLNPDGTFTLEGIPADSILQLHCACRGWANQPPTEDLVNAEFPKEADENSLGCPQLFEIGKQDTEITVAMQPLGSVTAKVVDQDGQPIEKARAHLDVWQKFFYSNQLTGYDFALSSTEELSRLRNDSTVERTTTLKDHRDFQTEFRFHKFRSDANGSVVIDGVPPGWVHITALPPKSNRNGVKMPIAVKSNENVEVNLSLNLSDPKKGGGDD